MYLVVSRWEALPGHAEEFERVSPDVRAVLRAQPGTVLVETFGQGGRYVVVHGYEDEAAYHAVVDDPDRPFSQALAAHRLEEMGQWLSSERGETFPYPVAPRDSASGGIPATLCRAIEQRDAGSLIGLYAPDAVLRVVDRSHTPSAPLELRGQEAIARYYEDICGRAMTHRIEGAVADGARLAFTEACEYPGGPQVYCAAMADMEGGKIVRQTNVQAWDE